MSAVDLSHYVHAASEGTMRLDLAVDGIDCAACIGDIEGGLKKIPGVVAARVNYTLRRVGVEWREGALEPSALIDALSRLGYRAHPFSARSVEAAASVEMKRLLRCLAIAGFAATNIMLLSVAVWAGNITDITPETRDFFHWLSALIALPAAAFAGQPFFASAFKALRTGRTNMDVPISIGVTLALGVSLYETAISAEHAYFDSAIMLLFFLLAGRTLDNAMRRKTRTLAGNLAALKAENAERLDEDGHGTTVPAVALAVGDRILVRPGDRVPADGVILSGLSDIDESLVTGETAARAVRLGETVYAGTLNQTGTLTLRVAAPADGSLLDTVQKLLDRASEARSRRVVLADRAARLYAPVVHLTAALSAAGWLIAGAGIHQAVIIATTVLIITCPCALALAVPAVQVVAAGALFRRGIFLNAGDAIERLAEIDTVVFDKTGTLTLPEPRAVNAASFPPEIVRNARRLAFSSRHPLAAALVGDSRDLQGFEGVVEEPGLGVRVLIDGGEARLGSPEFCGLSDPGADPSTSRIAFRHGAAEAVFSIRQMLRPDAVAVIRGLQARGLDCRILSGDREEAVAPIAAALGITAYASGMRPADKIAALAELGRDGRRVAMVGDGLNDAPALAAAHVSLSPITASDLTQALADAVFLGDKLAPVVEAIDIARRARRLMTANLWFSVLYNVCAVPLAILGLVTPLIAALAMSGSSLVVTLNALRARPPAPPADEPAAIAVPRLVRA
jgi:Cu2+-exporting ATPase